MRIKHVVSRQTQHYLTDCFEAKPLFPESEYEQGASLIGSLAV
jgi:hypothetical protein